MCRPKVSTPRRSHAVLQTVYGETDRRLLTAVGARIRALRKAGGLSQEKLAFASGLHRTYISSVERGERNIAVIALAKIARALNTPVQSLLDISSAGQLDRPRAFGRRRRSERGGAARTNRVV